MNLGSIILYVSFGAIAFLYTRECIRRHKVKQFHRANLEALSSQNSDEVFSPPMAHEFHRDASNRSKVGTTCPRNWKRPAAGAVGAVKRF